MKRKQYDDSVLNDRGTKVLFHLLKLGFLIKFYIKNRGLLNFKLYTLFIMYLLFRYIEDPFKTYSLFRVANRSNGY